jgi:hypothetical protein
MRVQHLDRMQKLNTHLPHAQSWVVSGLYGLLLYISGQSRAAFEALSFAQNATYLVGDMESYEATRNLIQRLNLKSFLLEHESPTAERGDNDLPPSVITFIPTLDNVSAKANQYGVPPELFLRALLHRTILFTDNVAIPPNVMTNSSVFVNQLLFRDTDIPNTFYLDFMHPVMARNASTDEDKAILFSHRLKNLKSGYITEEIAQSQIQVLDTYFESVGINNRYIFFSLADVAGNYTVYILRAVSERQEVTKSHLMDIWKHLRSRRLEISEEIEARDTQLATDMIETIINVVQLFMQNLIQLVDRSKLYNLSGLFVSVMNDDDAINKHLRENTLHQIS